MNFYKINENFIINLDNVMWISKKDETKLDFGINEHQAFSKEFNSIQERDHAFGWFHQRRGE